MKLLLFILSFAAILVVGVICVAPSLQDFIEGHLTTKAKKVLKSAEYKVTDVKMDHFHLQQVTIEPKLAGLKLDKEKIRKEVIDETDPILGIYARDVLVVTRKDDMVKPEPNLVDIFDSETPPPSENPELDKTREPASFTLLWNANEKVLSLDGKQTNKNTGSELRKLFSIKKPKKVNSTILVDSKKIANSKYLSRVRRDIKLLVLNSYDDLSIDFQDAVKRKGVNEKGYLKFKGTTGSLEKYNALSESLQYLESDDFEVKNELVFYPYVAIQKDALKEKITLTGCVKDRIDVGTLGSNSSRDVASNYSTDNKLVTHDRCLDINWHDEYAENLIAKHMNKVVDGDIIYRNNKLHSLSGISYDKAYVEEVKKAFKDTDIAKNVLFEKAPEKKIDLVEPEPSKPEITTTLADQLKEYKIFFDSGSSAVHQRYFKQLDDIAKKIKLSTDKRSKIIVGGYADTSGSAEQNKILSLKRARAVMTKLVGKGVNASRIEIEFFGAEANGKSKAESRRVEIKVRNK